MQLVLRAAGIIAIIVSVIWWIAEPSFDPLYAFITGLVALLSSFIIPKQETKGESLDQRNRRVMLDHVENFWVKGVLEKSLHGAALLELGIKEDPSAVNYPWTIKKESTNETLPAGKSMLEIFKEIGMSRSLLILGAPGSGKTTMLLELARQLIERARNDESEPIPVVFNLASWTEKQTLANWLADQLNMLYYVPKKIAPTLVSQNKMLLLLDGLDEVKGDRRGKCVETINEFRNEYGFTSLAVCSRIEEYRAIIAKLYFEGAITLQPLTSKQVDEYFDRFGKSLTSVKQLLKRDNVLQELVETPLILSIITLVYKDRKADELIASANLEEQREHLFDTYITRMFERSTRSENAEFTKKRMIHHLSWLARKMTQQSLVTYEIEAMQPSWLGTGKQQRLYIWVIGLIIGLMGGLAFGLMGGLIVGLIVGLSVGLMGGLIASLNEEINMVDRLEWSRDGLMLGLIFGLMCGPICGLISGLMGGLISGLILGLIVGLISGLIFGLSGKQLEETNYPGQRLKQTLYSAISVILISGLISGLSVGLISGLTIGLTVGLAVGLTVGLTVGLSYGLGALIQHYTLRYVLMKNGVLPRSLIPFLEHAVDLIFLRRVGGSYIFVHRLLMEHFAEMDV